MKNVKTVFITGASDGIGKALAFCFARRGFTVGILARRAELLEGIARELKSAGAHQVATYAVDVTDSQAQRQAFLNFENQFGTPEIFIANAGTGSVSHPEVDDWETVRKTLELNVMAAVDALEWMKSKMALRGSGILSAVSSVAGFRGLPDSGVYSASKSFIMTYLESLRVDLKPYGVRVVTIIPGYVDTPLTKKNKGKMPFLIPVAKAAEVFTVGLIRGDRTVVSPWQYKLVIPLLKWLPASVYEHVLFHFMKGVRGTRDN